MNELVKEVDKLKKSVERKKVRSKRKKKAGPEDPNRIGRGDMKYSFRLDAYNDKDECVETKKFASFYEMTVEKNKMLKKYDRFEVFEHRKEGTYEEPKHYWRPLKRS